MYPLLHHFTTLINDLQLALHDAACCVLGLALFQHLDFGVYGVAGLGRLGEFETVEAEESDQRVVVEVELKQQLVGRIRRVAP